MDVYGHAADSTEPLARHGAEGHKWAPLPMTGRKGLDAYSSSITKHIPLGKKSWCWLINMLPPPLPVSQNWDSHCSVSSVAQTASDSHRKLIMRSNMSVWTMVSFVPYGQFYTQSHCTFSKCLAWELSLCAALIPGQDAACLGASLGLVWCSPGSSEEVFTAVSYFIFFNGKKQIYIDIYICIS